MIKKLWFLCAFVVFSRGLDPLGRSTGSFPNHRTKCTPSHANVEDCTTHNVREWHIIQSTTILPKKNLTSKTSGTESGWTSKTILRDDSPWANTRSPSTGVISSDASTPLSRASQWILDPPRRPNRLITRRVTWLGELLSWTDFVKESLSKPMKNERSFLGNGESSYWTSDRNGKIEVNRTCKKS